MHKQGGVAARNVALCNWEQARLQPRWSLLPARQVGMLLQDQPAGRGRRAGMVVRIHTLVC